MVQEVFKENKLPEEFAMKVLVVCRVEPRDPAFGDKIVADVAAFREGALRERYPSGEGDRE